MPEPFKNLFSRKVIQHMADHFARVWSDFPRDKFVTEASDRLEDLELKQRSEQIMEAMISCLPDDFDSAAGVMLESLAPEKHIREKEESLCPEGISGWAIMPMTHYVGLHGLGHFDLSMDLMREMTKRFTSEFGIRFLIIAEPRRSLSLFKKWVRDPDEHVRRLVSEGSRPRLPWAMHLTEFIKDPTPMLPLLEALQDDESEYVRRSVANHLNDISKDHPDLIAEIAADWLKGEASPQRQRLIKHACRSLVKQGHEPTLKALGYKAARIRVEHLIVQTPVVEFGEYLEFELSFVSLGKQQQPLIIDYAVHHQKANGKLTAKVFKWKTLALAGEGTFLAKRRHVMRQISTRRYYPGLHRLEIFINGKSVAIRDFELNIP